MKVPWLVRGLLLALVLVVGGVCASEGPSARVLSDGEMARVVGAGIGDCQDEPSEKGNWLCSDTGTFACNKLCNPCPTQMTEGACRSKACWTCAGDVMLKECVNVSSKGCKEMGAPGASPCGNLFAITCQWNNMTSTCSCPPQANTGAACPRKHCKPLP